MEHKCPKCGSVIYSRRNVLCGVCGERLPGELLFNAEERAVVERNLAEAKPRARQSRALGSSGDSPGFMGGGFGPDWGGGGDGGGGD
jgi:uncharacterized Zn finger protein (UPF0148 family)